MAMIMRMIIIITILISITIIVIIVIIILIGTGVGLAAAIAYRGKLDAPAHQSPWLQLWQVLATPEPPLLGLQHKLDGAL